MRLSRVSAVIPRSEVNLGLEHRRGSRGRSSQNQLEPAKSIQNQLESARTSQDQPESTRTNQDQPESNFRSASENAQNEYFERRAEAFWNRA